MKDIIKEFRKLYGDDFEGGFRSKIETFILKATDEEYKNGYRAEIKDKVEKDLLIKCECEDGGCPNCSRVCKLLDELST